ncbi:MAG: metallopeptidase [Microgenomates group bacterium Gr01-1014_16]|nr:MAG: metallopeptidase [Microgenomates group bacterium Gr01-1014_16]
MKWTTANDITKRIKFLVKELDLKYISSGQIHTFRSYGSSGRATARIWSLPTIWQQALNTSPAYCLEVISERFDKLKPDDQERVLIHELLHIPKTFSGALVPHRTHRHRSFHHYHDTVESLFKSLKNRSYANPSR